MNILQQIMQMQSKMELHLQGTPAGQQMDNCCESDQARGQAEQDA